MNTKAGLDDHGDVPKCVICGCIGDRHCASASRARRRAHGARARDVEGRGAGCAGRPVRQSAVPSVMSRRAVGVS